MLQWKWIFVSTVILLLSDVYSAAGLLVHRPINILRNFHVIFHNNCVNLLFGPQCARDPYSPLLQQQGCAFSLLAILTVKQRLRLM